MTKDQGQSECAVTGRGVYNGIMPDWLKELRLLAEAEYHSRRILATLATTALDGSPRARTVIVRGIDPAGSLVFTSSAGSEKIAQIEHNPAGEMVFWFAHERQQYRMRGKIEMIREGDVLLAHWEELNDTGRAIFYWPPPGLPRTPGQHFPQSVASNVPPSDEFVVLRLVPAFIETLDLNEHPHCRQRWARAKGKSGWTMVEVTP